jgi:regulator of protease activity HflC (stomatin/prohibitin superfamily)
VTVRLILSIIFFFVFLVFFALSTRNVGDSTTHLDIPFRKLSFIPFGLAVLFFLLACIRVVSPGEVGIPVVLGNAKPPIQSGVNFTNPFASVKHFSIRTEEYTMSRTAGEGKGEKKDVDDSVEVLGKDGATGKVDATLLHRLNKSDASRVYRELGVDYVPKIIRPTSRTCIRASFAGTDMVSAATTMRAEVADTITNCIKVALEPRGLVLESLQLRDVTLSDTVQNAINSKVEAQQRAAQQAFELDKTKQQAQIRVVEAQGLADSQKIIQSTLTPAYLQYEYIKALQATVNSPNHSTLVLPFDKNLTPQFVLPAEPGK